ncbi:PREDICTED: cytochrome c oxidase subunit 6A1, mitochondrial-like [Wasmannia auropunctata]|uniref:cytochrome c oxidase subunit 6A1, mitochondrial-like n=1 Tax=Wasmannia auropunctata TaxID=64793 RepID=UPI0005ED9213|nr:PREDICTED: cytochrome c oxidase subunit 6A1, mitochondrial-like [Wasmannia auropunctata]
MTSFARIWRPSDLRCLTFRRKLGMFKRSKGCDSRTVSKKDDPCTDLTDVDDDPRCEPPSPPTKPPCPPPPEPPFSHPHADPRKVVLWRMLSFCALPLIVLMSVITFARHREKVKQPREPFLDLPYMYRRTKPFPWGDGNHSLFHNPVKNAVPPHGYEVEDPYALPKKVGN